MKPFGWRHSLPTTNLIGGKSCLVCFRVRKTAVAIPTGSPAGGGSSFDTRGGLGQLGGPFQGVDGSGFETNRSTSF